MAAIYSKPCKRCKKIFFSRIYISKAQWNKQLHCSPKCGALKLPEKEYLQQKLQYILSKTIATSTGCMEWQGTIVNDYGQVYVFNKPIRTHRFVWERFKGIIPKKLQILHSCDNPICCNIEHLFIGTCKDNMIDKVNKGRHRNQWTK